MVTRRVIGSWRVLRPDGTRVPGQGTITFQPSVLIRDSNTNQIVVQDPIVVQLNAQGAIDVQLQTTDQAGLNPTGWFWNVTEEITSLTVRRYQLLLPAGGTFNLSNVEVPPTAVPLRPQDQYLKRIEVGPTTVLNPNQQPTVEQTTTNSVAELRFSLPRAANAPTVGTVTTGTPAQGPDVTGTTTSTGDTQFNFRLPRAIDVDVDATVVNPDVPPSVSSTADADGDVTFNFDLPRAAEITLGTVNVVDPDVNPDVQFTVTDGDVEVDFDLPRAATFGVDPVNVVNPDQDPSVILTADGGDYDIEFSLPRAPVVTVDSPAGVLNPDQQPAVTSTTTDGDVEIAFDLPRAPTFTVGAVTVLDPDQQPDVFDVGTDGDIELEFDLPRAPTFTVGTVTKVGPDDPADVTDVGTDGDIVLNFDIPQGDKGDTGDTGPTGPGVASGGATGEILVKQSSTNFDTAWTDSPSAAKVSFKTTSPPSLDAEGQLAWDDLDQALAYRTDGLTIDIGQENVVLIRNTTGTTLTKGTSVCVAGSSAQRLSVVRSDASVGGGGCRTLGLVMADIPNNQFGFVSTFGLLRGVNTNAFEEGDELFISTTPGVLSDTPAASPGRRVTVGYVVVKGTQGAIFVTIRRGLWTRELDDVDITDIQDLDVLAWDDSDGVFVNRALDAADVGALPDDATVGDLSDVDLTGLDDGYVLIYDSSSGTWFVDKASAGAKGGGDDEAFWENDTQITQNYAITSGKNAGTFGPIEILSGVTVEVPAGSEWTIV